MKKKIIISSIIIFSLFIFFFVIPLIVAKAINDSIFKKRSEPKEELKLSVSDFPNLKVENIEFNSSSNDKLEGYLYSSDTITPKGVVIYAHGFGCGGSSHTMMFADYFVSNNYYYFTYDATANGASEGTNQKGLVTGVLDLDKAISCVKSNDKLKEYPIMLLGHSWGGYSVGAVLNMHPDVKAICSISGFNNPNSQMMYSAKKKAGSFLINLSSPYMKLYEKMIFHSNYNLNVVDGVNNSKCNCLFIHSEDDSTVGIELGYNKYLKEFSDNSRVKFIHYDNRGHGYIFLTDEARTMATAYSKEGKEFDKDLYINGLDLDLFNQILELYNNSLNN